MSKEREIQEDFSANAAKFEWIELYYKKVWSAAANRLSVFYPFVYLSCSVEDAGLRSFIVN